MLILAMLFSLAACGASPAQAETKPEASPAPADADGSAEISEIDAQLNLIYSQLDKLLVNDSQNTWYYAVTDLNHNGKLEFIAASLHPQDRSTNLKIWEVSADGTALTECGLNKDPDESFPDIMTDMSDTFHDLQTDTWYYLFYDNIIISNTEVYTIKTAVNLKDGTVSYDPYAIEHTVLENGYRNVSYTDATGLSISAEQFNAAGNSAFPTAERSNAAFEWLTADQVRSLEKLTDSYAVFGRMKAPTEVFPVPKPEALAYPEATPTPTPSPAVSPKPEDVQPIWLTITKNPTNENKKSGGTAVFVACANAYESLSWTFVSPTGGEYSPKNFIKGSDSKLSGEYSTTISVSNLETWMDGWGAYCTFYYRGQTARTTTAYMYVKESKPKPAPEPKSGYMYGTVYDWDSTTVRARVENGTNSIQVPWSKCQLSGEMVWGADVTVYWEKTKDNVVYMYIEGEEPAPQPTYGSMSGRAYHDTAFTIFVRLQNGMELTLDGSLVNIIGGNDIEGASCTVYYTDYPSAETIYRIDVYGKDPVIPPQPDPEPEPEPDPDPVPQPEPDPDPVPQPEPEPDPVPQPEPEPDPVPQPEPEPDPAPQPDPEPDDFDDDNG